MLDNDLGMGEDDDNDNADAHDISACVMRVLKSVLVVTVLKFVYTQQHKVE